MYDFEPPKKLFFFGELLLLDGCAGATFCATAFLAGAAFFVAVGFVCFVVIPTP